MMLQIILQIKDLPPIYGSHKVIRSALFVAYFYYYF